MTKEEFRTGILSVLKNPDTALVGIETYIDEFGSQADTLATLTAEKEESEKRIRDLQDTNMKLYLRQVNEPVKEEEEGPNIDDMDFDEYLQYLDTIDNNGGN